MEGGPDQLDLLDPKPELEKWDGKPLPESLTKNLQLAFIKPTAAVLASRRQFRKYGQSGIEISDYLPHLATVADTRHHRHSFRCTARPSTIHPGPIDVVRRDAPGGKAKSGGLGIVRIRQ